MLLRHKYYFKNITYFAIIPDKLNSLSWVDRGPAKVALFDPHCEILVGPKATAKWKIFLMKCSATFLVLLLFLFCSSKMAPSQFVLL